MLNHVTIMGRLTADPELKTTPSGVSVTNFTLASSTGRKRDDGSRITDFIECVAWNQQAEFAAKHLTKGCLIIVEGKLTPRTYEDKGGIKHKVTEVSVYVIHFADSKRESGDDQAAPQTAPSAPDSDYNDLYPY